MPQLGKRPSADKLPRESAAEPSPQMHPPQRPKWPVAFLDTNPLLSAVAAGGFAALIIAVYWIALRAPAAGTFHDDGIYLVTAKALAEGKGYRLINLPDEIPQTHYPPLFPGMLSVMWRIFPNFPANLVFLKTVPLLFTVIWCALVYRLAKRETRSAGVAAWIALFTAASPVVIFCGTAALSETVFASLCTGALLYLCRLGQDQTPHKTPDWAFAALLAGGALLTRTAALPLVATGIILPMLKQHYKQALVFFLVSMIVVAPWIAWQSVQHTERIKVDRLYYSWQGYHQGNLLVNFTWHQKFVIIAKNLLYLSAAPGLLLGIKPGVALLLFAFPLNSLVILGFLRSLTRGINALHVFLVLYCGMLLLWAYPPARFMVPLLPLLLLFAYHGLSGIDWTRPEAGSLQPFARRTCVAVLVVCLGVTLCLGARTAIRNGVVTPVPYETRAYNWQELRSLLNWLRENSPPEAVVLGALDPMVYLYTGRKATRGLEADPLLLFYSDSPRPMGEVSDLVRTLRERNITYIFETPDAKASEGAVLNDMVSAAARDYPNAFRLVKRGSFPGYQIFEVDQAALPRIQQTKLITQSARGER